MRLRFVATLRQRECVGVSVTSASRQVCTAQDWSVHANYQEERGEREEEREKKKEKEEKWRKRREEERGREEADEAEEERKTGV